MDYSKSNTTEDILDLLKFEKNQILTDGTPSNGFIVISQALKNHEVEITKRNFTAAY